MWVWSKLRILLLSHSYSTYLDLLSKLLFLLPSRWSSGQGARVECWRPGFKSRQIRTRLNARILPTVLLTPPASKAADMSHLRVPQNQALVVCNGFVPDIPVCGTHGREDLVNATITTNAAAAAEEEEEEEPVTYSDILAFVVSDTWRYEVSTRSGWPGASLL